MRHDIARHLYSFVHCLSLNMSRALSTVFSLSDYHLAQHQNNAVENDNVIDALTSEISILGVDDSSSSARGSTSTTCLACGISSFSSVGEQREHFKTDWHRYNVKLRVLNRSNISEDEFNAMVEQDDDVGSISGSDMSSGEEDDSVPEGHGALSPYCIFNVLDQVHTDGIHVGVWKCLLVPDGTKRVPSEDMATMFEKILSFKPKKQQWAVLMLQGGHFAGCIYTIQEGRCSHDKTVHEAADSCITEMKHKSFHRYVVRAKAGGKQSDKDATGKFAKSAGSRLRRYNEAILQKEIVQTLEEWHSELSACSLIFVSTPGSNRLVLFGGENPPLDKKDDRIRKVPFITRRPTISETKRVVRTLLTLYVFEKSIHSSQKDTGGEAQKLQKEEQKQQAEEKRLAAKLELQRQEEIGKERNRRKKQRQKEQKRRLKLQELKDEDNEVVSEPVQEQHENDLEAELKNLAASAVTHKNKAAPVKKESKARSKISCESLASRREKMAAAAEARAKALAAACSSQKLYQ